MLVDAYMKALTTENPDVALSAAKFIPQVILLCDGNVVFEAGVHISSPSVMELI